MITEILAGVLALAILVILTILVKSLTRVYENGFKRPEREDVDPGRIAGILTDAVNEALKLQEDRNRKRSKRSVVEEMSDEEIAERLEGKLD